MSVPLFALFILQGGSPSAFSLLTPVPRTNPDARALGLLPLHTHTHTHTFSLADSYNIMAMLTYATGSKHRSSDVTIQYNKLLVEIGALFSALPNRASIV